MKIVDPLRTFFLALVCKSHDSSHVMRDTHTNGRGDSAARAIKLDLNQGNLPAWAAQQADRLAKLRTFQAGGWNAVGMASSCRFLKRNLRDAGLAGKQLERVMFDIVDLARLNAQAA